MATLVAVRHPPRLAENVPWYRYREVETRGGLRVPLLVLTDPEQDAVQTLLLLRPVLVDPEKVRVRLYLNRKPALDEQNLRTLVSGGYMQMELSLNQSPQDGQEFRFAFVEKGTLSLYNRQTGVSLQSVPLIGLESSVNINTTLGPEDTEQLYNALFDHESSLHTVMEVSIRNLRDGSLRRIRSIYPLRVVLQDREPDPQKVLEFYYHDPASGTYVDFHFPVKKRAFGQQLTPNSMIRKGEVTKSVHALLRPSGKVASHMLNTSLISTSVPLSGNFKLNDLVLSGKENKNIRSLPVIDDPGKRFWKDRKTDKKIWYQKSFRMVSPSPDTSFSSSPFQFTFRKLGVDNLGNTVLEGSIRVTLDSYLDDSLKNSIESSEDHPQLNAVPVREASYMLELPYMNSAGEKKKSEILCDTAEIMGSRTVVTFRLSNEWIRVAYGLFAMGSGDKKARMVIQYNFEGYTEIRKNTLILSAGFKFSAFPVLTSPGRSGQESTFFNSKNRSFVASTGLSVDFRDSRTRKNPMVAKSSAGPVMLSVKPASIFTAPIASKTDLIDKIKTDKKYALQTYGRREEVEVDLPCTGFGAFYQEENQQGILHPVGCKDPYRLGQVGIPLYAPLPEMDSPGLRVYRSTQIPNRFLIEPLRYHIGRKGSNGEDAFEPNVVLYSTIDGVELERSNCVLDMVLDPDITPFEMYQVRKRLRELTDYEPKIDFITEIETEQADFTWTIPQNIAREVIAFPLGKSIRVTISCDIEKLLTLKSMLENGSISGRYELSVSDTPAFRTDLLPSLRSVTGPWEEGPLTFHKEGNSLSVKNEIESVVHLSRVICLLDDRESEIILNRTLPGNSSIDTGEEQDFEAVYAVYAVQTGTEDLTEIRNYIEDVECQLVLVNNIDFESTHLNQIVIEFRLQNTTAVRTEILAKTDTTKEILMLMPITDFLSSRIVEYRIRDHGEDWYAHHIAEEGNIINFTTSYLLTS